MYQVKRGHRVIERTTTPEMAAAVAERASQNGELIAITEVWQNQPEVAVADYFDGHRV